LALLLVGVFRFVAPRHPNLLRLTYLVLDRETKQPRIKFRG
jgi:hypothetical protein